MDTRQLILAIMATSWLEREQESVSMMETGQASSQSAKGVSKISCRGPVCFENNVLYRIPFA